MHKWREENIVQKVNKKKETIFQVIRIIRVSRRQFCANVTVAVESVSNTNVSISSVYLER